ncbi:MAG: phage holin family protein [Bacillaceae bacterium]|nr:phage holin family protein [Bacillaceae bacterium]
MLLLLIILTIIEFITGLIVALLEKKLNLNTIVYSLSLKVFLFSIVSIANITDIIFNITIFRDLTILFYILNQSISIIKRAKHLGLPIPDELLKFINSKKNKK